MQPDLFEMMEGVVSRDPTSPHDVGINSEVVFPPPYNPFASDAGNDSDDGVGVGGAAAAASPSPPPPTTTASLTVSSGGSVGAPAAPVAGGPASAAASPTSSATQQESDMQARLKMMEEQLRVAQMRADAAEGGAAVSDAPTPFVALPPKTAAGNAIFNDLLNRRRAIFAVSRGLKPKGQVRMPSARVLLLVS
jgi:hypothetical protein